MRQTAQWATSFASDWKREFPLQIHTSSIALDGSPEWHPDFARWLTATTRRQNPRNDEQRLRTTRVMRRLRRVAVREYECLFRILVLGERIADTTRWLNDRAERNGISYPDHRPDGPHYTQKDTLALVVAGIAYAKEFW